MNEISGLILASLAILFCLVAFFVALWVLFPGRIHKTQQVIEISPVRSLLVGLINFGFFIILILALFTVGEEMGSPLFRLAAITLLALLCVAVSFGLAGVVQAVGGRLAPRSSGVQQTAWGATVLSLACGLPFVGWFGLLPYILLLGLGALILSLFHRRE